MIPYYTQTKYLSLVSSQFQRFTAKGKDLWNCRCPYCGDSTHSKTKARGYFFKHEETLMYKCHNCMVALPFTTVLKEHNQALYNEMMIESLKKASEPSAFDVVNAQPKFNKPSTTASIFDYLAPLEKGAPAWKYLYSQRQIPLHRKNDFLYCSDVVAFANVLGKTPKIEPTDAIAIMCVVQGKLSAIQMRLLKGDIRYLTFSTNDELPIYFGLNTASTDKMLTLVEGPFDSTFIDNCVACTTLPNVKDAEYMHQLGYTNIRFAYDADYTSNPQVRKAMQQTIKAGYSVIVYDGKFKHKDINDAVVAGFTNINAYFNSRAFNGPRAMLEMTLGAKL